MHLKTPTTLLTLLSGLVIIAPLRAQHPADFFAELQAARQDSIRAKICYKISRYYWDIDADSALLMGQRTLDYAIRAHDIERTSLAYLTMGVSYGMKGLYPEALDCDLKALRLSEQIGNEGLSGNLCGNIGIVYSNMKDHMRALDYYRRALVIARHYPDAKEGWAAGYINVSETFADMNQLDSAIAYSRSALAIAEDIHDSTTLSASLDDLGDYLTRQGRPGEGLSYLQRALLVSINAHDGNGVASTHIDMAAAYIALKQYRQGATFAAMGLQEARKLHAGEYVKAAYHQLSAGYAGLHEFDKALDYRNREIALNDSLYTLEKEKQLRGLQASYDLEKKQHQLDLITRDRLLQQEELLRTRIRNYFLAGGVVLLGLWAFFLVRSNSRNKQLNRLLESRNREIEKKNQQLEELNAVKNKLLSIIGHDLRSPIASLKGFVDLLGQSTLSPDQIHYFSGKMSESLEGTSRLLDNLLFWAKSQMEGIEVNARPFDIMAVIQQNGRLVQNRAAEKKINVVVGVASSPLLVCADEVMIDMVIRNLVENALKFSRQGDTVTISATPRKDNVVITVQDTGQGIPLDHQGKIFRSITYTTTGTSRERGSGLGLSLCKELVEKNGGSISFESQPGKGTAFTFTLPYA